MSKLLTKELVLLARFLTLIKYVLANATGCVNRNTSRRTANTVKPPPPVRRSSSVTPSHQIDTPHAVNILQMSWTRLCAKRNSDYSMCRRALCHQLGFSHHNFILFRSDLAIATERYECIVRKSTTAAAIFTWFNRTHITWKGWRNCESANRIESHASQPKCFAEEC